MFSIKTPKENIMWSIAAAADNRMGKFMRMDINPNEGGSKSTRICRGRSG